MIRGILSGQLWQSEQPTSTLNIEDPNAKFSRAKVRELHPARLPLQDEARIAHSAWLSLASHGIGSSDSRKASRAALKYYVVTPARESTDPGLVLRHIFLFFALRLPNSPAKL